MSINVNTQGATRELRELVRALSEPKVHKAASMAINHTIAKARTAVSRDIRSVYRISAADVREATKVVRSSATTLTGYIYASSTPLPLSRFNPSSVSMGKGKILVETRRIGGRKGGYAGSAVTRIGTQQGVTVEILKGRKERLPSAFLLIAGSGKGTVMARGDYGSSGFDWGKKRLPINKLNTKSVYWASQNKTVEEAVSKGTSANYEGRLIYELTRALDGTRAR